MIYNSKIELDAKQALAKVKWLIEKGKTFEIKEKKARRSISQNGYLHLILGWFGIEFGYTLEEVKQDIFKKYVNPEIFYEGESSGKLNISIEKWRSTRDLDTGELSLAIERFRNFSAAQGCYLPEPSDLVLIQQMEREILKHNNKVWS